MNIDYNITGIKSIFKPDIYKFRLLEDKIRLLMKSYFYDEIKLQLLEKSELFKKTLGNNSDIIKKEMFSFYDKNKHFLTLLPEGTTSCTKFLLLNGFLRNDSKIDVWYISPMFRRERPQHGRQRMFYQIGIESYGVKYFSKELEHIIIFKQLLLDFKLNNVLLELNCLTGGINRFLYQKCLFDFFLKNIVNFNYFSFISPMKFLDKNKKIYDVLIPKMIDYLDEINRKNFFNFLFFLKKMNINFIINNYLVRGLEYYTNIIYEWTYKFKNKKLTVCAGGRYDNLSSKLGSIKTYSTGFALGVERFLMLFNSDCYNIDFLVFFKNKYNVTINMKYLIYLKKIYSNKSFIYTSNKNLLKKIKKTYNITNIIFF